MGATENRMARPPIRQGHECVARPRLRRPWRFRSPHSKSISDLLHSDPYRQSYATRQMRTPGVFCSVTERPANTRVLSRFVTVCAARYGLQSIIEPSCGKNTLSPTAIVLNGYIGARRCAGAGMCVSMNISISFCGVMPR